MADRSRFDPVHLMRVYPRPKQRPASPADRRDPRPAGRLPQPVFPTPIIGTGSRPVRWRRSPAGTMTATHRSLRGGIFLFLLRLGFEAQVAIEPGQVPLHLGLAVLVLG